MAGRATRATQALDRAGVAYEVHIYEVTEKVGDGYGQAVAAALGMPPGRVFKTLVAEVDAQPVVAVIPGISKTLHQKVGPSRGRKTMLVGLPFRGRAIDRLRHRRNQPIRSAEGSQSDP